MQFSLAFGLFPRGVEAREALVDGGLFERPIEVKEILLAPAERVELLVKAGYSVVDIPESHICCGSAGTYNILQPEIAGELRDRKAKNIKRMKPDLVATGNIGCITQLGGSVDVPVVHTIELLDWAYGGPVPPGLEPLARFVSNVPEPKRRSEDFIHA